MNWLPKAPAAEPPYQAEKIWSTGMVTLVVCRLAPAAGVNVNTAEVIERVVEKPTTVTVNPLPLIVAVTLLIVGAAALIRTISVGTGLGVISVPDAVRRAVIVTVPATVPVCRPTLFSVTSEPAGMLSVTVRPPVENCTVGSSGPESAANVRVRVTVTSTG